MHSLEGENVQLKKVVAELELDKLSLKESLTYLKPRSWRPDNSLKPLSMRARSLRRRRNGPAG
ncbi:MAG: hypothetical protein CBE16_01640 [Rhodospirillaceae bacterium TMED256]|nr:MAG: hypothetical protein CBE16_01640 [Rhodospirillaceae bacterium TMED256]